ncbi:SGNH/GDSL hydrolase family protein [Mesorhizobium sp. CA13]|uniref:SGNH/GDSL hydrolase family protein n=1 Tax=Mesorhizobium sp. CA13 TaxID=2876643 RepID=UPI001CCED7E4|nr:SGNH/GDSL hydrolase family protein [Mesorhizobium sp. CA13]MBZ9856762.1 SGNH/GDSL hydrolase family protein [Mesorhizobium sp. CA13]
MSAVFPVNPDARWRSYTAAAAQTVFSIPFPFQDDDDIAILKVALDGTVTTLARPTHYIVAGAGEPAGGSFALTVPAVAGEKYMPIGNAVLERVLSIVRGGRYKSTATDEDLDRLMIIAQEHEREIGRALKGPYGANIDLPPASPDMFLGWNETGDALENKLMQLLGLVQVLNEADMHSNSPAKVPAQQSVKAYSDNKVASVSIAQFQGDNDSRVAQAVALAAPNGMINVPAGDYAVETPRSELMALGSTGNGVMRLPSGEKMNRRVVEKNGIWNYKALWYAHYRMSTAGRLHIVLHGDSTVEGGPWITHPFYPEDILRAELLDAGLPAVYVSNFGKGGTIIGGLGFTDKTGWVSGVSNPALEPTGNPWFYDATIHPNGAWDPDTFFFGYKGPVDMVVIKYGVNDAALRDASIYRTGVRAALATARAHYGPYMSLVLASPNVITDSYGTDGGIHNRDEAWVESICEIEKEACLDYQAARYDTYSAFKARDPDDAFWLDSLASAGPPYRADAGVHPGNNYNAWIWGGLAKAIADPGIMAAIRRNSYRWISEINTGYAPLKASLPQDFGHFGTEGTVTLGTSDWLEKPGAQTTERAPSGVVRQEEWGAASLVGRVRYGNAASWSPDFIVGTKDSNPVPGAKFALDAGSPARVVQMGRFLTIEGGFNFVGSGSVAVGDILCTTPLHPRRQTSVIISFPGVGNVPALWNAAGTITANPAAPLAIGGTSYCGVSALAVA